MATYKVLQDIEAEDHILGPLSLRQFIFALIAALSFYLCYIVTTKNASFLIALFLPPGLFCAFFAIPFGRDQPTEIWALAKIRFYFKPRRRIWDQNGVKDLVTVNVPKKVEVRRTDGLSQNEVKSRLTALASTIDSRGWAIKDVDLNTYARTGLVHTDVDSDRLIGADSIGRGLPTVELVDASEDILDAQNNPIAHQFDQMITASAQAHREQLVNMLNDATGSASSAAGSDWFLQQTTPQTPVGQPQLTAPTSAADDMTTSNQLQARTQAQDATYSNMKTIQPMGAQASTQTPLPAIPQQDAAAAQLAANNDLNISTISRVANKKDLPPDEEVIIPLH